MQLRSFSAVLVVLLWTPLARPGITASPFASPPLAQQSVPSEREPTSTPRFTKLLIRRAGGPTTGTGTTGTVRSSTPKDGDD